jgi:hypothetical protein
MPWKRPEGRVPAIREGAPGGGRFALRERKLLQERNPAITVLIETGD